MQSTGVFYLADIVKKIFLSQHLRSSRFYLKSRFPVLKDEKGS